MSKEALIRVHDQFRNSDQANPAFTFIIEGLVPDDNGTDFNVSITSPVPNGSTLSPTPEGVYELNASGAVSHRYLFSYLSGKLTVSDKLQQEIIFDQNLTEINATTDALVLSGYSVEIDGNSTGLPISYEVDDASVARILVTQDDALGAYWKLNEELYNGVKDEKGSYSGTLVGLPSIGVSKVWQPGLFGNGLKLGHSGGRADLGSVQFDGNFSLSFWVKPDSVDANASVLLSKEGISTMNLIRMEKADGNGSVRVFLYPDGSTEMLTLETNGSVLQDQVWTQFCLSYNERNSTLSLYQDGELLDRNTSVVFTGTSLPQRFSSMQLGASGYPGLGLRPFNGMLDDLRLYRMALSLADTQLIYGGGGGDFDRLRIIGSGLAKITARQAGDSSYAAAIPVDNYITVVKVPQSLIFTPVADHAVGDFPFRLNAVASSGLLPSFLTSNPSLATVVGDYLYVKGAGPVTITANQSGDERYLPALDVNQSFTITYGNLFSDSAPGLRLWFDATDVNGDQSPDESFDFINGDRVSMWADKSGNTNHPIQATLNQMPRWTPAALNAKPILSFDSNFSEIFNLQNAVQSPSFVFLVHKQTGVGTSRVLGGDIQTTSNDGFVALEHASGNVKIVSETPSSNWSISTFRVLPNSQALWIDGRLVGLQAHQNGALAIDKVGESFDGQIAEVLVFDKEVNLVNRQKIEGYLAHKWGLNGQLPNLHPYHVDPPSFGGDQEIFWGGLTEVTENNQTEWRLPVKAVGDADFELLAYSTSGLPVNFISSNPSIAAISGNLLYILGVGDVTISAVQEGDSRYHPALPVHQILRIIHPVLKDDQIIEFADIPTKVRDDPPFQLEANATSSGVHHRVYRLPVQFSVVSGPASVDSNGIVTLDGTDGNVTITAAQSGSAYVKPALPISRTFEVSTKQRPVIIFPESASHGHLPLTPYGHRPLVVQGAYSTNGEPLQITSSNSTIVSVYRGSRIIPKAEGTVLLSFDVPESEFFVAAETVQKSITVIKPSKQAWRNFRRNDVRYNQTRDKFLDRLSARDPFVDPISAAKVFDEDYSDSDSDGFSNLFERALGLDSLGPDNRQHLPLQIIKPTDNRQRLSFIRYKNPLSTTGEHFFYIVEQSTDLQTWSTQGLSLEKTVDLGGGMQRETWISDSPLSSGNRRFLRLRVALP